LTCQPWTFAQSVPSKTLTVNLSAVASQAVAVNYAVTGTATGGGTDYTLANGTLVISAGDEAGTITISGIIDDAFDRGDETVIITLSNPVNAFLGNDLVHTYTITDNASAWTESFCTISSSGTQSVPSNISTSDPNSNLTEGNLQTLIGTLTSDPITASFGGDSKPVLDDWSVWVDGEITIGKTKSASLKHGVYEQSLHIGIDRPLENDDGIFGVALGLGKGKTSVENEDTYVKSSNYSLSAYAKFNQDMIKSRYYDYLDLELILGLGKLQFETARTDGADTLGGERDTNQIFASVALRGSNIDSKPDKGGIVETNNWTISPYAKLDASYTKFNKFNEVGGETALTMDELRMLNAKGSVVADISYLFKVQDGFIIPFSKFEYGLDVSDTSTQNMYYTGEGQNTNYKLRLDDRTGHNWKIGLGAEIKTEDNISAILGYRWEGKSSALSGITKNNISSTQTVYFQLDYNF